MRLDLSTVLLQWAAGGLFGGWVTTRRRVVGVGYGWLFRGVFAVLALGGTAAAIGVSDHGSGATLRIAGGASMAVLAAVATTISIGRRRIPVDDRDHGFPPTFDVLAPLAGLVALLGAASVVGGPYVLVAGRLLVGSAFLGLVTDAMLLGHWYLVQPGLARAPIQQLVRLLFWIWPVEVALLCVPTGMVSVFDGAIHDGYGGLLAWMWALSALTTLGLLVAASRALQERSYSAVMATTGLLYLGILTAFGTDVLARALLTT